MRSETVIILSCIEPSTLASFPRDLDPCVNEALRDPGVIERISANSNILAAANEIRAWKCKRDGSCYAIKSDDVASFSFSKRPGCTGSVTASLPIYVNERNAKVVFNENAALRTWSNPVILSVNGENVATIPRGTRHNITRTIELGKHAGRVVIISISQADPYTKWRNMSDHNFDYAVSNFKCIGCAVGSTLPEMVRILPVTEAEEAREQPPDVREEIAKVIQTVTVPIAKEITTPTPVPGVVIPKPGTGLPQVPVTIPTAAIRVPDVKIGGNTIEFQEIIPGVRPPAIPLLIPGLEKLPILPGWTIRSGSGKVIAQGDRLPTVPIGVFGIPIPPELDKPVVIARKEAETSLEGGYVASTGLGPERENYLEAQILAETEGSFESAVTVEDISEEALDMGTSADEDDMGFEDAGDDDVEI
jgi:hypothetical protein